MRIIFIIISMFALGVSLSSWAASQEQDTDIKSELSAAITMINISFSENDSAVSEEETDANDPTAEEVLPESGGVSLIGMTFKYTFMNFMTKHAYVSATFPLLTGAGRGYFAGAVGMNFFFMSQGAQVVTRDRLAELVVLPRWRFYAGPEVGGAYIIYSTEEAEKSDVVFEIGGHGGVIYNVKKNWGIMTELSVARAMGIATNDMIIKASVGMNYFL